MPFSSPTGISLELTAFRAENDVMKMDVGKAGVVIGAESILQETYRCPFKTGSSKHWSCFESDEASLLIFYLQTKQAVSIPDLGASSMNARAKIGWNCRAPVSSNTMLAVYPDHSSLSLASNFTPSFEIKIVLQQWWVKTFKRLL